MRPALLALLLAACSQAKPVPPTPTTAPPPAKATACQPAPKPDACVEDWFATADTPACVTDWVFRLGAHKSKQRKTP